ncbi:MAG: ABC transporter ATP-binding protein/permease [Synechococcales cyanobacterium]
MSDPQEFNFNRQLWRRLVTIAQPYFVPISPGGGWVFAGLLVAATVFVIGLMVFVEIAIAKGGQALFPEFFQQVAAGFIAQADQTLRSPIRFVALGAVLLGSLSFVAARQRLRGKWVQWGLLTSLLFLLLTVNRINVMISFVARILDNALQQKEEPVFWLYLFFYLGVIIAAIPILVGYGYLRQKLGLFWRKWLTAYFLNFYFNNRAYYELDSNAGDTEIDNPDQRITQDVSGFTATTLFFILDILDSILTLYAFTGILYDISKTLAVGLVAYASVGTVIAIITGRRLIKLNFNQLRLEANFRYSLVHVRDHAESIAFYRGEQREQQQVVGRLDQALKNFDLLIIWQALIGMFLRGYNFFTRIVPYLIVAPLYFSGEKDFGTITQAYIAFSQVLGSLSIVTNQIESISGFAAGINRLGAFHEALLDQERRRSVLTAVSPDVMTAPPTRIATQDNGRLAIDHLTLKTPRADRTLIQNLTLALEEKQRLLVVGSSGTGKSSLLRAIAGLWDMGQGTIIRPSIEHMLFLPQKPYMILGSLRDQLLYPHYRNELDDQGLQQILAQVNLGRLVEQFGWDAEADWGSTLSLGEQQRLAFARILVNQPRFVILDEATSALDIGNEKNLYDCLAASGITYLSVGHRPSLAAYHDVVLQLTEDQGSRILSPQDYIQEVRALASV